MSLPVLALSLVATGFAGPQSDSLTGPIGHYKETVGNAAAKLDFYPYAMSPSLVFDVRDSGGVPSLDLQGRLLELLLTQLLRDHPDLRSTHVRLAGNREALIAPLDKVLLNSDEWNCKLGRPRKGRLGDFLTQTINAHQLAAPLVEAFKTHGWNLTLSGVGRIQIERVDGMKRARLPVHIDEMGFKAVRASLN